MTQLPTLFQSQPIKFCYLFLVKICQLLADEVPTLPTSVLKLYHALVGFLLGQDSLTPIPIWNSFHPFSVFKRVPKAKPKLIFTLAFLFSLPVASISNPRQIWKHWTTFNYLFCLTILNLFHLQQLSKSKAMTFTEFSSTSSLPGLVDQQLPQLRYLIISKLYLNR